MNQNTQNYDNFKDIFDKNQIKKCLKNKKKTGGKQLNVGNVGGQ